MSEIAPLTEAEREKVVLASGSVNPELAAEIASTMGIDLFPMALGQYADSETFVQYKDSIRKREVIIVQSVAQRENFSTDTAFMELCFMIQAAKLALAKEITAMLPYFPYSRGDRKTASGTPIPAMLVAQFLEVAGADILIGADLHAQQVQGFFRGKFDLMTVMAELRKRVRQDILAAKAGEFVVGSLDAGATKLAQQWADELDLEMVQFIKDRKKGAHDTIESIKVPPGVRGKIIIAAEDIIATGGTVMKSAERARQEGAEGFMIAAAHSQFTGNALEKAPNSAVDRFYITNTLPIGHIKEALKDQVTAVSVGHIFGEVALRSIRGESLSQMFNGLHLR